jgi:2'-5' RNA ligase
MPGLVRAFFAVLLPESVVEGAGAVAEVLKERFPQGSVKWVPKANYHLTLRFFGDLDAAAIARASSILADLEPGFRPIPVRLGQVSAFPAAARPQTLWIHVEDEGDALARLAAAVDQRCREQGFGPADKPWKSHLTLGRAGRDVRLRPDPSWSRVDGGETCRGSVRAVALMRSELRPQGARYSILRQMVAPAREEA